jgi:ferredoxin
VGLVPRGAFHPRPDDAVPPFADGAAPGTVAMVGNVGQRFWSVLHSAPEARGPDPIDRWTTRVLGDLADAALFPFGGPPQHPFQRWARRADPGLSPSPLGILIHPEFGLWHALRGALLYRDRREVLPAPAQASPCDACAAKPCVRACPVGAFTAKGYDTVACRSYLRTLSGQPCMIQGCQARLACPVGRTHAYRGGLAQHLMREFARR